MFNKVYASYSTNSRWMFLSVCGKNTQYEGLVISFDTKISLNFRDKQKVIHRDKICDYVILASIS